MRSPPPRPQVLAELARGELEHLQGGTVESTVGVEMPWSSHVEGIFMDKPFFILYTYME
jgi:hypothetical protein